MENHPHPISNGNASKFLESPSELTKNSKSTFEPDLEDTKSAIIEVLPPPAADPIAGRYRQVFFKSQILFSDFEFRPHLKFPSQKLKTNGKFQNVPNLK